MSLKEGQIMAYRVSWGPDQDAFTLTSMTAIQALAPIGLSINPAEIRSS